MWRNDALPNSTPSSSAPAATPPPPSQQPSEGVLGKRKANDTTQHDSERFAKRFNLLSLEANAQAHSNSNYYIPISTTPPPSQTTQDGSSSAEAMSLDDSRHRIYISNLDHELASIAASDAAREASSRLIFLPDIERHFHQIPAEVLRFNPNPSPRPPSQQELVLYNTAPALLTQGERGSRETRKAILEARQRAREKALLEATRRQREMDCMYDGGGGRKMLDDEGDEDADVETAHGYGCEGYGEMRRDDQREVLADGRGNDGLGDENVNDDDDAMEMD